MSQAELDELAEAEAELRTKLAEIAEKKKTVNARVYAEKAAADLKREMEKPLELTIAIRMSAGLLVKGSIRPDYLKILRETSGRVYQGSDSNLIPIAQWDTFLEKVEDLPGLELTWSEGVQEDLEWFITAPPWSIRIEDDLTLRAKPGPTIDRWILHYIPGAFWQYKSSEYQIPLNEGWRIIDALKDVDGVIYEEDSEARLIQIIERRANLNRIATKEKTDWPLVEKYLTREIYSARERKKIPWHEALDDYQKVAIEFGYETDGRCVNGDDTGLGKTWEGMGLAEILRAEHNEKRTKGQKKFSTLIVCKAANMNKWAREIRNLTGEDPVICKTGKINADAFIGHRDRSPYWLISWSTVGKAIKISTGEVESVWNTEKGRYIEQEVITREQCWPSFFLSFGFNMMILDESHKGKNSQSWRFKGLKKLTSIPRIYPMSASPVMNRTGEWWTTLHLIAPDQFKSEETFINQYTYDGQRPRNVEHLHEMLRPIFLRRKKTDVWKDLPPINRIYETCMISDDCQQKVNKIIDGIYVEAAAFDPMGLGGTEMGIMGVLAQITRLKQTVADETTGFTADLSTDLIDNAPEEMEDPKVLIFSQYMGTALDIARKLGSQAVCTVERRGTEFASLNPDERDKLFEEIRHNPDVKYLVTTLAAQEGHDIDYCDWVVFNEPFWGPKQHEQCEGRAYGRANNPHHITSYYVTAEVEIIEWIVEMIADKAATIDATVESVAGSRVVEDSVAKALIQRIKDNAWKRGK